MQEALHLHHFASLQDFDSMFKQILKEPTHYWTEKTIKCLLTCTDIHCEQEQQYSAIHGCRHVERGKGWRSYRQLWNTHTHTQTPTTSLTAGCVERLRRSALKGGLVPILDPLGWLVSVWTHICICLLLKLSEWVIYRDGSSLSRNSEPRNNFVTLVCLCLPRVQYLSKGLFF